MRQYEQGAVVQDYYADLQVTTDAEPEVIEGAYKRLIFKYHPDRGGDQERARAINAAYSVLRDASLRAEYDRELLQSRSATASRTTPAPATHPPPPRAPTSPTQRTAAGRPRKGNVRYGPAPAPPPTVGPGMGRPPTPFVAAPTAGPKVPKQRSALSRVLIFVVVAYFVLLAIAVIGWIVTTAIQLMH